MLLITNGELTLEQKKALVEPLLQVIGINYYKSATGECVITVHVPRNLELDIEMMRLFFTDQTVINHSDYRVNTVSGVLLDANLAAWLYNTLISWRR